MRLLLNSPKSRGGALPEPGVRPPKIGADVDRLSL